MTRMRMMLPARALRLSLTGGFFLAMTLLAASSGRANDFVRIGSPFANPVNLKSIATVYDRIPSTYEAWAVGEEVSASGGSLAPPKGVLLYFNGTFWSNIPLEAGTPALTSVSGQRYLTSTDECYQGYPSNSQWRWKSSAWAVGKQGTILKLDPYTNAWSAEKKVNVPVCSGGSNNGILCDTAANIALCGTAGYRTAESFEGEAAGAPLLHVEYVPNVAPTVSAGLDQTITLPTNTVTLDGAASDDGLPSGSSLTYQWSTVSGGVTFGSANAHDTSVTLPSVAGTYVFRLTVSDSVFSAYDEVQITVQPPPSPTVIERRVATGIDDAEEYQSGGVVNLISGDLELVYDSSTTGNQYVGMRFQSISVPKDAIITNAYIQFKVDRIANINPTDLTIKGQAADDALTFSSTIPADNVSSRPPTNASVLWSPPDWNTAGEAGANQRTPELKGVIQEIVSRAGWGSGNALAIIITGTGRRPAESYEGDAAGGPLLHIEYLPTTASRAIGTRVAIGTDDAEESATGTMSLSSSDLELVYDGNLQKVGMRFQSISVPKDATITKAYVQFAVDAIGATGNVDPVNLTIQGQAADNALTFSSTIPADNVSSRPRTSVSTNVSWSPPAWSTLGEAGANQRTPDLKNVIQEIVSRSVLPGWVSGNALAIIITGTGRRTAESYEGSTPSGIRAPLLLIEYTPPNAAPTVSAGPDQTITLGTTTTAGLDGAVADDGPLANVSTTWSRTGGTGTGTVLFNNAIALDTTATGLSQAGTYVLTLTANDGAASVTDTVTITVQAPPSPLPFSTPVATGSDDAEENASGSVDLGSADLQLAYNAGNQTVGLRFGGVTIPPGSAITNAYVQFKADEPQNATTELKIEGQADDNAATFLSSNNDVSSRPPTNASVLWSPPAWDTVGQAGVDQRTPDLTSVIQEIVNRTGWASNALAIIITGTAASSGGGSCSTATRGCTAAELKKPAVCAGGPTGSNNGALCPNGDIDCTGGATCKNVCTNWTSIDFNAVAAAHETQAIAVGTGSASTRPLFTYAETLASNNGATTCANKQLRQHAWSQTGDGDFGYTDDVRAAYYIDKDHAWLAGKDNVGNRKLWKYSQQNGYETKLTVAGQTFTSVAATFHPLITAGEPLKSLVWLGSEDNKIFRYNEATGSVSEFAASAPIRSLALARRAGGRGANLVTNPSFEADRGDAGGKHNADGWQSSGSYTNARGNTGYTSFIDQTGYKYIGEPWQSIAGVKNEASGNGLYVTYWGLDSGSFPGDFFGRPRVETTNLTTTFGEDLTPKILKASGLQSEFNFPPFEIGTIITGYLKIPNNTSAKEYEFQIEQGGGQGRVAFNVENDVYNLTCESGSSCTTSADCPGGQCVDRTSFPATTSSPYTASSAIAWTPGTCSNSTLSTFTASCFDDSECFRGTCRDNSSKSCTNNGDCEGTTGPCDLWDTTAPGNLCQGASAPGTKSLTGANAVTFPANGGIKAKECTDTFGVSNNQSCTTTAQCTPGRTCNVVGSGWYPFAIQYYQPWTPRCSNNSNTPCVKDADCGTPSGIVFCKLGKRCATKPNISCFNNSDCEDNNCQSSPNFPGSSSTLQYKGTCFGGTNNGKACRNVSDCSGGSCDIKTDPPSPLKFQYRQKGISTWTDVLGSNLLSPSPNLPQSEVAQEIPLSLLPGTAYKISGKYRVEFTDQFDLYSPADPRWNKRPHAGVMTRCKNSSGGNCGYEMNLFQTDRAHGVGNAPSGECKSNGAPCVTNQECVGAGGGVCVGSTQTLDAVVTKRNYDYSGIPAANDAGQTLEVVCFADVGAKIACDDISVTPENEAAVPGFDTIDVWAVGDKDANGATVYRNTIDVSSGTVPSDLWQPQKPPVPASLASITTPDPYHFWAVGENPDPTKERATILRLSPANVTGWAWIGASTDASGNDPIGWIDFNCGNQGTCASQPSSFGVNVGDSEDFGQCANNLSRSCKAATDCGGDACVKGTISGSAWLGSQDAGETVDYGPCTTGVPNDSCDNLGQCYGNSRRLCSASSSLCFGTCQKNQGFRCKTDSDCKIKCSDNPLACRSSGWLSFDKTVTGPPPDPAAAINPYLAKLDPSTDAIEGWARLQFGKCAGGSNDGLACFQNSDCGTSVTCDYTNAPSKSRPGVTDAEAGWVKLRGNPNPTSPVSSAFVSCKDCTADPLVPADQQSCKICTDSLSTTYPACNQCSVCTAKLCPDKTTACRSNLDCGGAECKTAGQCSGTTTKCFTDDECAGGSCINFGGTCSSCTTCSQYGISVDRGSSKRFTGFAWSPDLGWMDFGALRLGGQLFFQTKFGDIYSGEDIGSAITGAPPGFPGGLPECNATYRLIAAGTITNFCSSAPITTSGLSAFLDPSAPLFPLPRAENRYQSQIGSIDVEGLVTKVSGDRNKFGDVIRDELAGNRLLRDYFPARDPNVNDDTPLLGKVYHVKGNLTIDQDLTFDPPANATPQKSGAGTFVVDGNLVINQNLSYLASRPSGIKELRQLPSLAFIVKGSITIDAAVSQLVGTYFTENTITVASAPSGDNQLVVRGAMIASQFNFLRKYLGSTGALEPAEKIIYDGRLQANAPPGLSALADGLPNIQEVIP